MESQRLRELLAEQGYEGGKSITDDYVREVRPFFVDQRTFQRTVYRPGDVAQFDLWQPKREIPAGYSQVARLLSHDSARPALRAESARRRRRRTAKL